MTYTKLQTQWLKHHYSKWKCAYAWSAGEFARQVKQPPAALAEVLGIPVEEFGPFPAEVAAPVPDEPPVALPDPETATVIIEPGVELMPREKPPAAAAPPPEPYRRRAYVLLAPGRHIIDGQHVDIHPPVDNPIATLVEYEVTPDMVHIIDGKNALVQTVGMFRI